MVQRVTFNTADGVEIVGAYRRAENAKAAALLLHMMPATKESWEAFSVLLAGEGVSSLAIDLRGHGESVRQGDAQLDFRSFEDRDHMKKSLDVEAAAAWLIDREGTDLARLAIVGASIGANLGLRFALAHPEVRAAIALSPGLNYRGVTTDDAVSGLRDGQMIFLAASEEDAYSYSTIEELEKVPTKAGRTVRRLKDVGHGTTMLEQDPGLMRDVSSWLSSAFS